MSEFDTTSSSATDQRDPAEIEREIRQTQAEMSRTVDQLGDKLTPRNLVNSLFDKADGKGIDAQYLLDTARRNPLAVAMIAIGGIWLASGSDAKLSSLKPSGFGGSGKRQADTSAWDDHHRGYVEHMGRIERLPEEDDAAFRRRRDLARSNYLMIEQRHDEDESGFRKRLDDATEALRQRRHDLMEKAGDWGTSARQTAGNMAGKTGEFYDTNPLVGGMVAALLGALAGAAAPITRTEEEQLGKLGAKALDTASEKAQALGDLAREKKDELVAKADQAMKPEGGNAAGGAEAEQSAGTTQPAPAL
ncbi:MAG: DUF3618 domain-containing protein [Cypionkella sp.]